ncbi:hypothetical protein ACET3Z_028097 [Daucus carota]
MCMIVEDGALLVLVEWACGGILSGRSSGSVSGSAGRKHEIIISFRHIAMQRRCCPDDHPAKVWDYQTKSCVQTLEIHTMYPVFVFILNFP